MVAEFRGPSPHDLGTAELATARFVDESVEVSLHLLDDWHRPMGPIIQVRMSPEVARSLAERLTAAADARPGILFHRVNEATKPAVLEAAGDLSCSVDRNGRFTFSRYLRQIRFNDCFQGGGRAYPDT